MAGCQSPPQTLALLKNPPPIAKQYSIANVPFFPQQQFYCGPTTLSEVANYHDIAVTPEQIAPLTFVPGLEGSLQIEMLAATRQLGLLAYAQKGTMHLLLSLVAEDIPVIVLQNNSISLFPQWHYAVVTGYDLETQNVILHSGITENHRLNFSTFERTWQRGDYWMLAMLPAGMTSPLLEPFVYARACQDLIDTGQELNGIEALKSAIKEWPDYWLSYFLLANHYLENNPKLAVDWYQTGFQYGKNEVYYLNNYAYALGQIHCYAQAQLIVELALDLEPNNSNVTDTKTKLLEASKKESRNQCKIPFVESSMSLYSATPAKF